MIASEAKTKDVTLLLKDWVTWHAGCGAAMSVGDSHLRSASYGPGGYLEAGREFDARDRRKLSKSFRALKHALSMLAAAEPDLYIVLRRPYLMDGADPSLVNEWREKSERIPDAKAAAEEHDLAIRMLCLLLYGVNLHSIPIRLMSDRERGDMERQNAEVYAVYRRMLASGMRHDEAVEQTSEHLGRSVVPPDAIERIVEFRSEIKTATCVAEGCKRAVFQQNLCQRHYQRAYRERKKQAS